MNDAEDRPLPPGRPPLQPGRAWGDHQRSLLQALVDGDPGIHILRAAHVLGMNWNTCYHHVRRMAAEGTIVVAKVRGRLCLFDRRGGAVAPAIANVLLRDPRTASVVRLLMATPGMNQQAMAEALGIAPSAVHRHLRRLQAAGLVQRVRDGRAVLNLPTPALRDACRALHAPPAPGPSPLPTGAADGAAPAWLQA